MFEPYRLVLPIVCLMSILMSPLARSQSDPATIIATGNNRGAPACSQCHGADLNGSPAAQIPGLRGQSQAYLVEQLQNFADGKRHNPLMQMVASHLDEADIHVLAQYISSMPIHNLVSHRPKVPSLGKMLAEEGDPVAHIPACLSCHGPYGEGVAPYIPFVYGQPAPYLRTQLNAWHGGQRPDGFGRLMNNIALRLSPEMIESVSCYFAAFSADQKATSGCPIPVASHTDLGQEPENQVKSMQQKIIDQGQRIFDDTPANASAYAWGGLSCQNCHLDHGLRAESAPLWAAYPIYPLYRKKNSRVITFAQRMQNCFVYSLNRKLNL